MSLIPLILDREVPYALGSRPVSILTLPLATGTVLDHLAERLEEVGHGEIFVVSRELRETDVAELRPSGVLPVRVVEPEGLSRELERSEASDYLLVVDPRLWPTGGYDFEACQRRVETSRARDALHRGGGRRRRASRAAGMRRQRTRPPGAAAV